MIIMILSSKGIPEHATRWTNSLARTYDYLNAARGLENIPMIWATDLDDDLDHQQRARHRFERYKSLRKP